MKNRFPIKFLAGTFLALSTLVQPVVAQSCPGTTIAGTTSTSGTTPALLNLPAGVAVDAAGFVYVADVQNHRIVKFAPNAISGSAGIVVAGTGSAGSGPDKLNKPTGVALDGSNNIYVADSENHRIQKFGSTSVGGDNGITVAGTGMGGYGSDQLNKPYALAIDGGGYLYIADQNNHRVQKFGPNSVGGNNGATIAGLTVSGMPSQGSSPDRLAYPLGVAVDASGNVYIADAGNHRIQKFAPNSVGGANGTTVAGITISAGTASNQLNAPIHVFVDGSGAMYVADLNNHRIQKFAPNSVGGDNGTTVAGTSGVSGSSADQLDKPSGVAVDAMGVIYVADQNNHRIQKFTPTVTQTATISQLTADESGCPVRLRGAGNGQTFVFSGPNGYVFSEVHRTAGTYQPVAFDVRVPGTYTLQAGTAGGCGSSVPAQMTVTVARSCP
nr:NHL repeat-containing protein [uncultured Arsenicibacter sp.]